MTTADSKQQSLLTISLLLSVGVTLILLLTPPATGYELSIYAQYHPIFWVMLCLALITSTLSLFDSARTGKYKWRSLVTILVCYGLFLAIPEFRGYALFGRISDLLAHIGWAKTLGSGGDLTIYPGFHILMVALDGIGVSYTDHRYLFSILFLSLWIVGCGLLTRRLTGSPRAEAYGMVAATPLALGQFHPLFHPAIKSFLLLPIALLVVDRSTSTNRLAFGFCLVVLTAGFVILHPMTALLFVLAICVYFAVQFPEATLSRTPVSRAPLGVALAGGTAVFGWLLHVGRGEGSLVSAVIGLFSTTGSTPSGKGPAPGSGILGTILSYIGGAGLTPEQILIRFIDFYGAAVAFLVIAGVAILWSVVRTIHDPETKWVARKNAAQFLTGGVVAVAFMLIPLTVSAPVRVARYGILFGILGIGIAGWIYEAGQPESRHRGGALVVVLLVLVVGVVPLGVMTSYPDNYHLTHTEETGNEFVLYHHNPGREVTSYQMDQRQATYIAGDTPELPWIFTRTGALGASEFPHRLGYPEQKLGESVGSGYLITKDADTRYYQYFFENQYDELTYYTDEDRERALHDDSAVVVYRNGGYTVWLIQG